MNVIDSTSGNVRSHRAVCFPRRYKTLGSKEYMALVDCSHHSLRHDDCVGVLRRRKKEIPRKLHRSFHIHGCDELHDGRNVSKL